jgi:4-hydroxybenzoate polyprenyltransferase
MLKNNSKTILNYLGQLRIYSFLDIFVLATALSRSLNVVAGILLLWISFLAYLESRHNDQLRLKVNRYLFLVPFVLSLFLLPIWLCLGFALFSVFYTNKKKNKIWGVSAPFWRAAQNGIIALGFNPSLAILVFVLTFIRNLVGVFRDAGDDKKRSINTIPAALGFSKNQTWAFYGHMLLVVATTIVWFNYSFLDVRLLLPIIILQILSYPLTPRLSNPRYLDIYRNVKK